ncbi:hypothetical protein ACH49C_28515 [Rhodococcus sp. NPDC019609]
MNRSEVHPAVGGVGHRGQAARFFRFGIGCASGTTIAPTTSPTSADTTDE